MNGTAVGTGWSTMGHLVDWRGAFAARGVAVSQKTPTADCPMPTAPAPRGQWAQTATGRMFYPLDPRPEDICIEDIAAGLSRQCRYAGQLRDDIEHYSIAEHCVCLARYFHARGEIDNARWALMHDAAEFCGELIRPIKCHVPEYRAVEKAIHDAIFRRFRLPLIEPDAVNDADNRILLDERDAVMSAPPAPWDVDGMEPLGAIIVCYPPRMARFAFLHWFGVLFPKERPEGRVAIGSGHSAVGLI